MVILSIIDNIITIIENNITIDNYSTMGILMGIST